MADADTAATTAPAPTAPTKPAKSRATKSPTKKKSKSKTPMNHPHYRDMIRDALAALKDRGGSSRQAILKYVMANFKVGTDERMVNNNIKLTLRAGVKNGTLKQSKGTGASGSFKIGEKKTKKSKATTEKKAVKPKKAAAPKGEKKPAKKAKKPKAAKSKPAKKVKTPKKAAVKKPKKAAKSPKKAKKAAEVKTE